MNLEALTLITMTTTFSSTHGTESMAWTTTGTITKIPMSTVTMTGSLSTSAKSITATMKTTSVTTHTMDMDKDTDILPNTGMNLWMIGRDTI